MPASIAQHARIKRFSFIFLASPLSVVRRVYAKPDMRPLGPNIADKGSVFYHFSATSFDSVDGTRHYRVWTAVPNTTAPASGYPILYMLDGNAVMDRTDDELLKQLSRKKNTASDRGCRVSDQPPFRSQQQGLHDYTPAAEAEKQISTRGVLAVRVVAQQLPPVTGNAYCPKGGTGTEYRSSNAHGLWGTPTAASSCWILAVLLLLPVVLQRQPVVGQRL